MADAFTVALTLLSARELSEAQLRARLKRREISEQEIAEVISRLKRDGALNDRRVALAIARIESAIKHRGRSRVLQAIRRAGIDGDTADEVVREVFAEVDEADLLERAFERRLRGKAARDLDERGRARIVRGLIAQGFRLDSILKKLKH
jgi:regulatory protein